MNISFITLKKRLDKSKIIILCRVLACTGVARKKEFGTNKILNKIYTALKNSEKSYKSKVKFEYYPK